MSNNPFYNILNLIAYISGALVTADIYQKHKIFLCNPIVKLLIMYSIIYINIKDIKMSILLFLIILLFFDDYIKCSDEPIIITAKTD